MPARGGATGGSVARHFNARILCVRYTLRKVFSAYQTHGATRSRVAASLFSTRAHQDDFRDLSASSKPGAEMSTRTSRVTSRSPLRAFDQHGRRPILRFRLSAFAATSLRIGAFITQGSQTPDHPCLAKEIALSSCPGNHRLNAPSPRRAFPWMASSSKPAPHRA